VVQLQRPSPFPPSPPAGAQTGWPIATTQRGKLTVRRCCTEHLDGWPALALSRVWLISALAGLGAGCLSGLSGPVLPWAQAVSCSSVASPQQRLTCQPHPWSIRRIVVECSSDWEESSVSLCLRRHSVHGAPPSWGLAADTIVGAW
jgi:hypothetical protein